MNLVVPCAIGRAAFLHRRELVSDELLEQALTALKARAREEQ